MWIQHFFAEVRAEEKGITLTHCVIQSSSSRRRRGDKKRKRNKCRHHLKHQSYVLAPSDSVCVILTKLLLINIDHRWWSKRETSHYGGSTFINKIIKNKQILQNSEIILFCRTLKAFITRIRWTCWAFIKPSLPNRQRPCNCLATVVIRQWEKTTLVNGGSSF